MKKIITPYYGVNAVGNNMQPKHIEKGINNEL
jgi:hypothetical protein